VTAVVRETVAAGGSFDVATVEPGAARGGRLLDVRTGDGRRIAGGSFVFAAGAWLPRIFPDVLGHVIRVTKQDILYVGPPGGDRRYEAGQLPAWVDYDAAFYGVPSIEGRGFKVAPDRYGSVFDPSAGDRIVEAETIRLTRRFLAGRMPELAEQPIVETRVCQYETTPDTHFVIDRHPEWANVWLVGGGSGHGFKHGPVIGETVVARVQGQPPEPGHERFSIERERTPALGVRTGGDSIVATWEGY
jgi:glycine/D-amino acid oxidase-like deaminating enzyme